MTDPTTPATPRHRLAAPDRHPLKGPQLDALHGAVNDSLAAGIAAKGASIDDFRDPDGVQGSFQDLSLIHI